MQLNAQSSTEKSAKAPGTSRNGQNTYAMNWKNGGSLGGGGECR